MTSRKDKIDDLHSIKGDYPKIFTRIKKYRSIKRTPSKLHLQNHKTSLQRTCKRASRGKIVRSKMIWERLNLRRRRKSSSKRSKGGDSSSSRNIWRGMKVKVVILISKMSH